MGAESGSREGEWEVKSVDGAKGGEWDFPRDI